MSKREEDVSLATPTTFYDMAICNTFTNFKNKIFMFLDGLVLFLQFVALTCVPTSTKND